jgi:hypothetical protein
MSGVDEQVTFVELSVKLSTGQFESRVNVPITATAGQRKKFVETWFALLQQALDIAKPTGAIAIEEARTEVVETAALPLEGSQEAKRPHPR